jgi:hypothetical protein
LLYDRTNPARATKVRILPTCATLRLSFFACTTYLCILPQLLALSIPRYLPAPSRCCFTVPLFPLASLCTAAHFLPASLPGHPAIVCYLPCFPTAHWSP